MYVWKYHGIAVRSEEAPIAQEVLGFSASILLYPPNLHVWYIFHFSWEYFF